MYVHAILFEKCLYRYLHYTCQGLKNKDVWFLLTLTITLPYLVFVPYPKVFLPILLKNCSYPKLASPS